MIQLLRWGLEALLLFGLLYIIFIRLNVLRTLKPLGLQRVCILLGFIGFWMLVQAIDHWQYNFPEKRIEFFPISRFAMFQNGNPSQYSQMHDFFSEENGKLKSYALADFMRGAGNPTLVTKMNGILIPALQSGNAKKEKWAANEAKKYIRSIYNVLQYQKKELPDSISFAVVTVDLTKKSANAISRKTLVTYRNPFSK